MNMETPNSLLSLTEIDFSYDNQVLFNISLEIHPGEVVALLGPNGSGKSTLLGIATGALKPQSGKVMLQDKPVAELSRRESAQMMALVSESADVRFPLSVLEFALMGRFAYMDSVGFDTTKDVDIAIKCLTAVNAVQFSGKKFNELSSGERQRVVLARALAQEPQILLLDEPTANADIAHQISLLKLIKNITHERNLGALIVTHEINSAAEFADRVVLMKDGRAVESGTPAEVLRPESLKKVFDTQLHVDENPFSGKPRISWMVKD